LLPGRYAWLTIHKDYISFRLSILRMSYMVVVASTITFGLFHGANPSHGWPLATLYSMRSKNPFVSGLISSSLLAGAHFVSSIIVVIVYILVSEAIEIPQLYLRYGAAIGLGILAVIFWRERSEDYVKTQHGHLHNDDDFCIKYDATHEHTHWHKDIGYHSHEHIHRKRDSPSLKSMTGLAFTLGFAHEEEFVILAIAAGSGGNPLTIMFAYASSVAVALIGMTLLSLKIFKHFEHRIINYGKYLPKITSILIAFMALGFALGLL
jgi:nickel/cobalt transporter (NicO) family protein